MSKAEILDELTRLTPNDRSQVFARLAELHEADLVSGDEVSPSERQALDAALADFDQDQNHGKPWREVLQNVRRSRQ